MQICLIILHVGLQMCLYMYLVFSQKKTVVNRLVVTLQKRRQRFL